MARTDLTAIQADDSGADVVFTAAILDGHAFANNGKRILLIHNGDTVSHTVTVPTTIEVEGLAVPDRTKTVAAGAYAELGPFPAPVYAQALDDGKVWVDYDAVTGMEVALLEVNAA